MHAPNETAAKSTNVDSPLSEYPIGTWNLFRIVLIAFKFASVGSVG